MAQSFPSHDINPNAKGQQWYLDMAKSCWSNWQLMGSKSFAGGVGRYNRIKYYSLGKQSIEPYKPMLAIEDKDNQTWMAIDMTPIPVIPKLKRIINSLFRKIDMKPEVDAIDTFSESDKKEWLNKEYANIKMREVLAQLGQPDDILNDGDPSQPKTEEELSIHKDFTWKHNLAIKVEQGLEKVFLDNGMDEQREANRESLIEKGAGGFRVSTDKDGRVVTRPVELEAFICSFTNDPFMQDLWYAGEVTFELVSELRNKTNLSEDQLEDLARKYTNQNGNPQRLGSGTSSSFNYDSSRIPVLDLTFKTWNKTNYEKRALPNGNFVLGKTQSKKNDTDKRTYLQDESADVCTVKWIVDTEFIYEEGYENNMVKKVSRYWDCTLPYIMVAPLLFKMETTSLVEELIPWVDAIHIAWYKLQNVIAQARPKGVQIEIGALEDVSLTGNGETVTPLQLIDLFTQKGIVVYRRLDASGNVSNYSPIQELNNGLGSEAAEYYNIIDRHFNMIKSAVGLNDFTDASTPDPKSLNGVANMAAEATNNALHHIFSSERNLLERVSDNAAARVHDSITFMKSNYYEAALGKESVLKTIGQQNHTLREFGIKIRMSPTAQEKAKLEMDVTQSLANREITIADKYAILNITNTKQAQQVLAYRVKKNTEEAQQRDMEKIKATTDQQKEAAIIAEQEKRKTDAEATENKIKAINAEWDRRDQNLKLSMGGQSVLQDEKHQGTKEIQAMTNETQIKSAAAKTQSKQAHP